MFDGNKVSRLNIPKWLGVFRADLAHGAYGIIAVHDITLGTALGGCRMIQVARPVFAGSHFLAGAVCLECARCGVWAGGGDAPAGLAFRRLGGAGLHRIGIWPDRCVLQPG